jgi:hypothetical protein
LKPCSASAARIEDGLAPFLQASHASETHFLQATDAAMILVGLAIFSGYV